LEFSSRTKINGRKATITKKNFPFFSFSLSLSKRKKQPERNDIQFWVKGGSENKTRGDSAVPTAGVLQEDRA